MTASCLPWATYLAVSDSFLFLVCAFVGNKCSGLRWLHAAAQAQEMLQLQSVGPRRPAQRFEHVPVRHEERDHDAIAYKGGRVKSLGQTLLGSERARRDRHESQRLRGARPVPELKRGVRILAQTPQHVNNGC